MDEEEGGERRSGPALDRPQNPVSGNVNRPRGRRDFVYILLAATASCLLNPSVISTMTALIAVMPSGASSDAQECSLRGTR